ncbi:MAG: glutamate--cysteine ligase [Candidatus Competibacterales bacterium]
MTLSAEKRLTLLFNARLQHVLKGGAVGLEQETLRVASNGHIASTPHPEALGSALTHPFITTDYSEALLEFVTPPTRQLEEALAFLDELHRFTHELLPQGELLWGASMPCTLGGEADIPIARYGDSKLGRMKHIYRRGLGHRYGKTMQLIAGIHFNYSFPDSLGTTLQDLAPTVPTSPTALQSAHYLATARNLLRFGWLVLYLFGASPAVCTSFLAGRPGEALRAYPPEQSRPHTHIGPWATSLRMSDIGYTNHAERRLDLAIDYSDLDGYVDSLLRATTTPNPDYQRIGVVVDGDYRQLNANWLQIENEFYSMVRPKCPTRSGERPLAALRRRGVAYIELRSVDLNPLLPLGIDADQVRFLELLLIYCLLCDSPPLSAEDRRAIEDNQRQCAAWGREASLTLQRQGRPVALGQWARELLDDMAGVAEALDGGGQGPYNAVLNRQRQAVEAPELTPSARILAAMADAHQGFYHFTRALAETHRRDFLARPLDPERRQYWLEQGRQSWRQQRALEAGDDRSFEDYLKDYFDQR